MSNPPPLPDAFLRNLHLAEFAAGWVSPETKAFLLKIEPLLPSIKQDGLALISDLVRAWPAVQPVLVAIAAHVKLGATVDNAVATVSVKTAALVPTFDQQDGGR